MTLDANTPVPTHDENVAHATAALNEFIFNNQDKFDRDGFIPDDVDPNTMSSIALKDAMQPKVYERSGDLLTSFGNSAEEAYANLHDMDESEVVWIMEMANSIMCYITHLNEMAQDRIETMAMSHVPEGHPMQRDYARVKNGSGLPPGLQDLLSKAFGGEVQMIDMTGSTSSTPPPGLPPGLSDLLRDLPTADLDDIPPDERL
jgi:hypothetical protein